MSVFYRCLVVLFLLLGSASAFACYPAKIALENRVAQAEVIYIGHVNQVVVQKNSKNSGVISAITTLTPYVLTVKVLEKLKGSISEKTIAVKVVNCGSGSAKLGDKVVVFYSEGLWFVQVFKQADYPVLLDLI